MLAQMARGREVERLWVMDNGPIAGLGEYIELEMYQRICSPFRNPSKPF